MQRVTITLDDELLAELDQMVERRGYQNRSEAVRDLARSALRQAAEEENATQECVAALVYVFDHEIRNLPGRLTRSFHAHHNLSLAEMHVHLDHASCLEVAVLRGRTQDVRHFADHVVAERGVRHGRLIVVPVDLENEAHPHGARPGKAHLHARVWEAG